MVPSDWTSCPAPLAEGFYTSEVRTGRSWPLRTFLPIGYEPNYPYPLLVFLHGHGSSEKQVLGLAPRLSRRNYICIGLRGPGPLDLCLNGEQGYSWGPDSTDDALIEEYVLGAIEQTRRHYHVHSERVYLAGFCEGATLAYRLGLSMPERFAGIVSLNGCMPRHGRPLLRFPEVRDLKVLVGHGIANAVVPLSLARSDYRLLYTAGLAVQIRTYAANHRIHPRMLSDVNHWIMQHINEEHDSMRLD